jgi:replicative DNA helicase
VADVTPEATGAEVRSAPDAELAVLGACFTVPASLHLARTIVAPEKFSVGEYGECFAALCRLVDTGTPVDRVTLASALRAKDKLNVVTARLSFDELEFFGLGAAQVETHARVVADHWEAREFEKAGLAIVRAVRDPRRELSGLRALAAEQLALLARHSAGRGVRSFAELAEEFYRQLEVIAARKPGTIDGVTTGLRDLDDLLSGLHGGDVILVGARPRVGKTSLVVQMAVAIAAAVLKPVLGFSLEMNALALFGRTAYARAGVNSTFARRNMLTEAQRGDLLAAVASLSALQVFLGDGVHTTVGDVRAQAYAMKARAGLAAVFIDYLQLVQTPADRAGGGRGGTREREVAEISRALKSLAIELDVPVIVLSQLNRDVDKREDKRPGLADLRESGALEQDADVVLFLYRDELYNKDSDDKGIAEVIVAKQRNGPADTVRVKWEGPFTRFADLEEDDAPQSALPLGGGGAGFTPDPEELDRDLQF